MSNLTRRTVIIDEEEKEYYACTGWNGSFEAARNKYPESNFDYLGVSRDYYVGNKHCTPHYDVHFFALKDQGRSGLTRFKQAVETIAKHTKK